MLGIWPCHNRGPFAQLVDFSTTYRTFQKNRFLQDVSYSIHYSVRRVNYGLCNMLYVKEADCYRDFLETPVTSFSAAVPSPLPTSTFILAYFESYQKVKDSN